MKISVIVPNNGRDTSLIREAIPPEVEYIEINKGFERSKQRNMGILQATGKAFLFLDSDQVPSPGLFRECRQLLKMGFTALYIPEVILADGFWGKVRKFEREFYTGTAVDVPRFVHQAVCPFFDERLSGPEDSDWSNRIRGPRATTQNVLYHYDNISLLTYFKKKAYYAKSMARYRRKWPNDPCLNFKYRCWTVFTEKGKWRKLVRHPILSLGILFIIMVRGIIYARSMAQSQHRHRNA